MEVEASAMVDAVERLVPPEQGGVKWQDFSWWRHEGTERADTAMLRKDLRIAISFLPAGELQLQKQDGG
jgi:hypothetical protein